MQVMLSESSYEARPVHPVADPSKTVRQLRPGAGGGCLPPCLAVSEDPTQCPSWPGPFVHVGLLADTHPCRALAAQAGLLSPKNFSAALEWTPICSQKILHFCCPGIPPPQSPQDWELCSTHGWVPSPDKYFLNIVGKMLLTETHASSSVVQNECLPVEFQWKTYLSERYFEQRQLVKTHQIG